MSTTNEVERSALAEFELFWAEWGERYEAVGFDADGARLIFLAGVSYGGKDAIHRLQEGMERVFES